MLGIFIVVVAIIAFIYIDYHISKVKLGKSILWLFYSWVIPFLLFSLFLIGIAKGLK
jgi:hypothetical protein